METSFSTSAGDADAYVALVFEDNDLSPAAAELEKASDGALSRAMKASRFTGASGQTVSIVAPAGVEADRVLLLGAGGRDKLDGDVVERCAAAATRSLLTSGATNAALLLDDLEVEPVSLARAALGARLASYRFDKYRTKLADKKKPSLAGFTIVSDRARAAKNQWKKLEPVADGVDLARDLMNEPANILHPESFAEICEGLSEHGLEVEVLGEERMTELGMHALLGVGRGSDKESKLVIMRWSGGEEGARPIAFVGKGVCFDSGGLNVKYPWNNMAEMKGDMGGAAAVTGLMRALAGRDAKVNAIGVIGLVENMPDAAAQKPGDIVTSMSKQTIEVLNTDAEGRLVLADALWYTQDRFNPRTIIDLATLTGAMVVALGPHHAGLFANDDTLAERLTAAGKWAGEPVWRMPLGASYDKMIDSDVADMKNVGGPSAGSITAAQFLQRFVKDAPWAHLDIAPTAWKSKSDDPREPHWATGWGVRILNLLVSKHYES